MPAIRAAHRRLPTPWFPRPVVVARVFAALVLVAVTTPILQATPAASAGETLETVLRQVDGTGPFDSTDGPGLDAAPDNGIVRTNDTLTYLVEISVDDASARSVTFELGLPRGVELDGIPPYCGATSSVTPELLPEPEVPTTPTSWEALPAQTLRCDVGDRTAFSTFTYPVTATVRPEVPNGTALEPVVASTTSADVSTPAVSPAVLAQVSARAQFDLSKNSISEEENRGYFSSSGLVLCADGSGRTCQQYVIPMLISGPAGGKGVTPMAEPVTFTDDLRPESLYGPDVLTHPSWIAAGADAVSRYGAIFNGCRRLNWSQPHAFLALGDETNAVRQSGTTTCAQPGGPGTPVSVSIEGMDSTAYTAPTEAARPAGRALPADRAYVYSWAITMQIPIQAVNDLGLTTGSGDGQRTTLNWDNRLIDFAPVGIDGTANDPAAEAAFNDHRASSTVASTRGSSNTWFAGVPGDVGNVPPAQFNPGWAIFEGPTGGTGLHTGEGQVLAGDTTLSILHFDVRNGTTGQPVTFLGCKTWDPAQFHLVAAEVPGSTSARAQAIESGGDAAWLTGRFHDRAYGTTADPLPGLPQPTIQYGTAPARATCDDGDSTVGWFDDPAAVPGNDPTLAASGTYTAVTAVRVHIEMPAHTISTGSWAWVAVHLRAREGQPSGTALATYGAMKRVYDARTMAEMLDPAVRWFPTTYDPATNGGRYGDRLYVGTAIARLAKEVRDPNSGDWVTTTPAVTGGDEVEYRLRPTLISSGDTGVGVAVRLEDCLPTDTSFRSSNVAPSLVQRGAPTGSELDCPADRFYVRWDLTDQRVNDVIAPVEYTVGLSPLASSEVKGNEALVSSPADASDVDERTARASIQVVQPAGLALDKVALTPIVEINRLGETAPDPIRWQLDLFNLETSPGPTDPDIIDVLPSQGEGATDFDGALVFDSAVVTAGGAATRVLVTGTPPASIDADATAPSNDPMTGTTIWCEAGAVVFGAGSASDCPADNSEVTGLRIVRPGAFGPGSRIRVEITMTPTENGAGDVYQNTATARAVGLDLPIGPIDSSITVVSSSIADRVWEDRDGDGLQGPDEPGVGRVTVDLQGIDASGNVISASTETASDGTYSFDALASGSYNVSFAVPNDHPLAGALFSRPGVGVDDAVDSDGDLTTGVAAITLDPNSQRTDVDQGLIAPASIAGSVLDDLGRPIDGVSIELTGADDLGTITPVIVVTDAAGSWQFGDLRPGTYRVTETQPPLWADAGETPGGSAAVVVADDVFEIVVASNDRAEDNVFGEMGGSLSGQVFHDVDENDANTAGIDVGIAGVDVRLRGTSDDGTPVNAQVDTASDGTFAFRGLPAGTYVIEAGQPSGYADGADIVGDLGGTLANDIVSDIVLTPGTPGVGYDFGERTVSLSGVVWLDDDDDGQRDGDEAERIEGVVLRLHDERGDVIATATTDLDGAYRFEQLLAGSYVLVQEQPSGLGSSTPNRRPIELPTSGLDDVDFGEDLAVVSGVLWADGDGDGVRQGDETVRAGVGVELLADGEVLAVSTTGPDGSYRFAGLRAGQYEVRVRPPVDERATVPGRGTDTTDSDVDWVEEVAAVTIAPVEGCDVDGIEACPLTDRRHIDGGLVSNDVDLSVTKRALSTAAVNVGDELRWEIDVTNVGTTPNRSVRVTDVLPDGLTFVSAAGDGWECGLSESTVTCRSDTPLLPSATTSVITLVTRASAPQTTTATTLVVENGASVVEGSGEIAELDASNNRDTATARVQVSSSGFAFTGGSVTIFVVGLVLLAIGLVAFVAASIDPKRAAR